MAQVRRIDGEFGRSLVCIGSVLSLAVVPTALQKLHKCVTQNTTELLQDTEGNKEEEGHAFKNRLLEKRQHVLPGEGCLTGSYQILNCIHPPSLRIKVLQIKLKHVGVKLKLHITLKIGYVNNIIVCLVFMFLVSPRKIHTVIFKYFPWLFKPYFGLCFQSNKAKSL